MKLIKSFFSLFESAYGEYTLDSKETQTIEIPILERRRDPEFEFNDKYYDASPIAYLPTGEVSVRTYNYEKWVAYHKKTGLPKYKYIYTK